MDLGFWNKVLVTVLLYGGLMTLAAVEVDRFSDAQPILGRLDNVELGVIILAGGSVGLQFLRKHFVEAGQWISARRFALILTGSLAGVSAAAGSLPLALFCVMVMATHVVLPVVLND